MKLRSHLLNVLVNDEVEAYLKESDVIIVPFGPTELMAAYCWIAKQYWLRGLPC